jgi:hypothetical protein
MICLGGSKKWYLSLYMSFLKAIVTVSVKPGHGNLSKVCKTLPTPWSSLPIPSRIWATCPGASKEARTTTTNCHGNNPEKANVSL